MRTLHTLLMHPKVARIHCQVIARGARADDDHAATLDDIDRHGEGCLARVLKHAVDVDALTSDVPNRLAELAHFLHPGVELRRVYLR